MVTASLRIAAVLLGAALLLPGVTGTASAQSVDPKAGPRPQANDADAKKEGQRKLDEFAEAAAMLSGPAAHPECVWLGRRVVRWMWSDDLDTAFRHLDLYDRFGCPAGHIPATFRCLVRQPPTADPKQPEVAINARVHACWINPNLEPAAAAAAAPAGTTNR
jgi:hypothetical protein